MNFKRYEQKIELISLVKKFLLAALMICTTQGVYAQCYETEGLAFSISSNGGNQDIDYETRYILSDYLGTILEISSTTTFSGKDAGLYKAYAINYELSEAPTNLQIGVNIEDLDSDCIDVSESIDINICRSACDIFDGNYNFNAQGGNTSLTTNYLLVDEFLNIVDISTSPSFSNIGIGDYLVFAINYESVDNLSNGVSINDLVGSCFDLSNPIAISSCTNCSVMIGEDFEVCEGLEILLTSSASSTGGSYSWNTGDTGPNIMISASATTEYIVTFTDDTGCEATDSILLTVLDPPTGNIVGDNFLCLGENTTLTASGGSSYQWIEGSSATTAEITVNPIVTTVYTVLVISSGLCVDTVSTTVLVEDCNVECGYCVGDTATFSVSGGNSDFSNIFVLTDLNNIIVDTNSVAEFELALVGEYKIFPINYDETNPPLAGLDIGSNINNVTGICFDIGAPIITRACQCSSIGNYVWNDVNVNGIQDGDEVGINGVIVNLYDANNPNNPIATTTTMQNPDNPQDSGYYIFDELLPGNYYVEFVTPNGFVSTTPNSPDGEDIDSDLDDSNGLGTTATIQLMAGEVNLDIDAGFYQTASLGDYVWLDADGDGIQDADEEGINGLFVNLYSDADENGVPDEATPIQTFETITRVDTGEDGYYLFDNLVPGKYIVEFTKFTNSEFTTANYDGKADDATDGSDDSDADPVTGLSHTIDITAGELDPKIDAGIYLPLSLGDFVWIDENNDGEYQNTELPVIGAELALWSDDDGDGLPDTELNIPHQFTGFTGNYLFEDLAPGDYVVQVVPSNFENNEILDGFISSTGNDPSPDPDDDDSNIDDNGYDPNLVIGVISRAVTLKSNDEPDNDGDADKNTNLTVDFGFFKTSEIGDYVWNDEDADGIQDSNEDGVNGVEVILYDATTGEALDTMLTMQDPDNAALQGFYLFEGLMPGDYYVEFATLPAGFFITDPNEGTDDGLDSDVDDSNGPNTTPTYTLGSGESNRTVDAGIFRGAVVGNYFWEEFSVNNAVENIQDPTDIGINGVLVELFEVGTDNLIDDQLTTDGPEGPGYYLFTDVKPNNYYIKFTKPVNYEYVVPNFGSDDMADSDVIDPLQGLTTTFQILPGDTILDIDAGVRATPLPVDLIDFYGIYNDTRDVNELTWITATEINNDRFEVEVAFENGDFKYIGEVKGQGNTTEEFTYNFDDRNVSRPGTYYYRLRQVDFDESFEYSNIISINVERMAKQDVDIFPIPSRDFVNVKVEWDEGANVKLSILDAAGQIVSNLAIDAKLSSNIELFRVPVYELPKGIYLFRIDVDGTIFNKKVLIID